MSSFLSGAIHVAAQTLHSSSADQMHNLGSTIFSNDGRAFRYAKAGSTALTAGLLQQAPSQVTGDQNLTAVAASVDDLSIASTTTVTVSANDYAEGFVLVTVTPGVGRQYKIKGHSAYTAAAPTFNLAEPVKVALTTTSRLDVVKNNFRGVRVSTVAGTGYSNPVGVAVHPIAASEFGWVQVGGIANVLADGALTVGLHVVKGDAVAGAVESIADGANELLPPVGIAVTGVATTEYGAVKLGLL